MPTIPDLPANTSLAGLSILITGSNVGLGYESALLALRLGASPVYLAVRTVEKGNKARESLLADPEVKLKNPNAVVKVYQLEMDKWEGVTSFADKFITDRKAAGEGLDIAILNAGIINPDYEVAPTGNEEVLQVNHLSTALLSLLLLPLLEDSTTPQHTARLTIISSGNHKNASLKSCPPEGSNYVASLNDKKTFGMMERYNVSKLLINLFLRQLAEKVPSDKVIINTVCPGMIKTELNRKAPWWAPPVIWLLQATQANPVEKGAMCYIHAVACVGKESHGKWYQYSKLATYSNVVTGPEGPKLQKRIWNDTLEILQKVVPNIGSDI